MDEAIDVDEDEVATLVEPKLRVSVDCVKSVDEELAAILSLMILILL